MLADRFGAKPVIAVGSVHNALGLWMMSVVGGERVFIRGAGVLLGLALAALNRCAAP
jgi:hypothetical protein